MAMYDKATTAEHSYARWEKREHGKCSQNGHLSYRVRKEFWVEVRCKLCRHMATELYSASFLKPPAQSKETAA